MIISLSGRLKSGKTSLANELTNIGYKKIAFADFLKNVLSSLYDEKIEKYILPEYKSEKIDFNYDYDTYQKLISIVNEPLPFLGKRRFSSRREILQYIGTEVCQKYDKDFHVKKTMSSLHNDQNYVFDDCRFINEFQALKSLNAYQIFVLRPDNFDISNHISEVELNWSNFDYYIINSNLNRAKKTITKFAKYGIKEPFACHKVLLSDLKKSAVGKCHYKHDTVMCLANNYIKNADYIDHAALLSASAEAAYYAGVLSASNCIKKNSKSSTYFVELSSRDIELVQGFANFLQTNKSISLKNKRLGQALYKLVVNSSFIIENLKYWNLKPDSRCEQIPDIIRNDLKLLKFWILGLIDSSGSVYISNNEIYVRILASESIIDHIKDMFGEIFSVKKTEKIVDNLFSLTFSANAAISFYNEIYHPIALDRKWYKFLQFFDKE